MGHIINPNLIHLHKHWLDRKTKENLNGKAGALLEGGSRSGKTWSSIDFLIYLCSKRETNAKIVIIKETYNSFKTTLYDDFNRRLPDFGIKSPFANKQEVSTFRLWGNTIHLLGADSETVLQGVGSDYLYFNELLDVSKNAFDQSEMRCRKFFWADYNPKATDHWVYDKVCARDNVAFLKTTFLDNPGISLAEKTKILSYEPTPYNIQQGTADDYMWNVYGLGIRSAPEGLIFQHVTWVKDFPANIEKVYWGLDFGYTNSPSALVKIGIIEDKMYCQCLFYAPTASINELEPAIRQYCPKVDVWADPSGDSGGKGMISGLRHMGYRVMAANTFPGSIKYGLSVMKKYKQFWIDSPELRKEQGGYRFREINGIKLDQPIDDFNHAIDGFRMAAMSNLHVAA